MSIPKPLVDEVLQRTDIAELVGRTVTLRRNGRTLVGLCPFHQEKTPSFNVIPHKGIYHCFGCGEGGDAIAWLRKTRGMSFPEAVRELAAAVGVTIEDRELAPEERARLRTRADLHGACEVAERLFHTTLLTLPEGEPGRAYLAGRGISLDTARAYRLGYAPDGWSRLADALHRERLPPDLGIRAGLLKRAEDKDRIYDVFRHRLVFPIVDDRGRPIAFGGRLLPEPEVPGKAKAPKYLNSAESDVYEKSKVLYGLHWARTHIQRTNRVILVEGYFDAVALWQAGFGEAVATCGTALTPQHLEVLKKLTRTVIALFDTDEAGQRAATRSMDLFLTAEMSAYRLDIGEAKDPDEFVQKFGADAFGERLARAEPLLQLIVRRRRDHEGSDAGARARVVRSLAPHLRALPESQLLAVALDVAHVLEMPVSAVLSEVRGGPRAPAPPATPPPARWMPSKELAHLLWLLIHFPDRVAPALADVDPDRISDNHDLLAVIARLAGGVSFTEVCDSAPPDLARALRAIAARPAEYQEETAALEASKKIARLELTGVTGEIHVLQQKITGCDNPVDKSSYAARLKQLLQRRLTLEAFANRGSRPTTQ